MTEPDPEIEAVLRRQMRGLGAIGSGFGGVGAEWAAQRLRTETAADTRHFEPARSGAVLAALAQLLECTPNDQDGTVMLRGVVGSGFGGMNPTYVLAVVDVAAGSVSIAAHAKEGLIKQRSAEKAVRKILAELPVGPEPS